MSDGSNFSLNLAEYAAGFPSGKISARARDAARRSLLDGLGVMLGASGLSPDITPFVAMAKRMGGGNATILGHDILVSAAGAALANGAMAHAIDFEDSFDEVPCHPNASLLPACMAIAESHGPISGLQLLDAIVLGCDVACRIALGLTRPLEEGGWYPPPLYGLFGATAAVGRLLGLDPQQMRDAFSLALCQAGGPGEIKYDADTVIRAVREAFPAQAALMAGLLARDGVRGFAAPFEGKAGFARIYAGGHFDPARALAGLGTRFVIEELSYKRWPACRGTHAYIEAARMLIAQHGIVADDITKIHLTGGPVHRMLSEPHASKFHPATAIDAKFSLPFTVASAFTYGDVDLASFAPDRLREARVTALAEHVEITIDPSWTYAQAASGVMDVVRRDGAMITASVPIAQGHPSHPLTDADIAAKFLRCAGLAKCGWDQARARRAQTLIAEIESLADVAIIWKS